MSTVDTTPPPPRFTSNIIFPSVRPFAILAVTVVCVVCVYARLISFCHIQCAFEHISLDSYYFLYYFASMQKSSFQWTFTRTVATHLCAKWPCKRYLSFFLRQFSVDANVCMPLAVPISSTHFFFFCRLVSLSACRHAVDSETLPLLIWCDILDLIRVRYAPQLIQNMVLFSIRKRCSSSFLPLCNLCEM